MTKPVRVFIDPEHLSDLSHGAVSRLIAHSEQPNGFTAPFLVVPIDDASVEAMVYTVARILVKEHADICNVNMDDAWTIYGDEFNEQARRYIRAALGLDGGGA